MKKIVLIALLTIYVGCTKDSPVMPVVDQTPPSVEWLSPDGDSVITGSVTLSISAVDYPIEEGSGVARVHFYRNGVSPADWRVSGHADSVYTITWDTEQNADGIYTLEARAWDGAGNLGSSPSLVVRVQNVDPPEEDRIPPNVQWILPESDSILQGEVNLVFSVTDDDSVSMVLVYRNGLNPAEWRLTGEADTLYSIDWDTREVADGFYMLEVRAWDRSGNLGISPVIGVRVQNEDPPAEEDRIPPDLWWESPSGGTTLIGEAVLALRFFDESGVDSVRLFRNGNVVETTGVEGTRGTLEYFWNTESDSDGVHIWEAIAWDKAGNIGSSRALLLRVQNQEMPREDRTPPVINWLSPLPGDTVQGAVNLRFEVMDDSEVDSVWVFLNGRLMESFSVNNSFFAGNVSWRTNEHPDAVYLLQVRAKDTSANVAFSEVISLTVWNLRPCVLWVPDDYETIQGAINASRDGDTVRVSAGTYYEGIWFVDKSIWIESEDGPENTKINGIGWNDGVRVIGNSAKTVLRGFEVRSELNGIRVSDNAHLIVINCIVKGGWHMNGLVGTEGNLNVFNTIIDGVDFGIYFAYSIGTHYNNILINCNVGIRNLAVWNNLVVFGWNLFWNNQSNWRGFYENNDTDIFENPRFVQGTYRLEADSPCVNAGKPDIENRDGTRSHIGITGGPYSY